MLYSGTYPLPPTGSPSLFNFLSAISPQLLSAVYYDILCVFSGFGVFLNNFVEVKFMYHKITHY